MEEYYKEVSASESGELIKLIPSLDGITNKGECDIKRGDVILIDVTEKGKKTGKKELVIVAGFTHHPGVSPSTTIWYGDAEHFAQRRGLIVIGRFFTEEFKKGIIKAKIPEI